MTHLLALWNPSYANDPLEAHLSVLHERIRRWHDKEIPDDDVGVWWGLIRSPNRLEPLPHLAELEALAEAIDADPDTERHLYLTDYRSLVVGELQEIAFVRPDAGEPVPAYYAEGDHRCDAWLRLGDLRTLVRDDLPGVIEALRALRNVRYHDKPVSLYGGMVQLPLIVRRDDAQTWFSDADTAPLDGKLWAEFDREHGSAIARMSGELRDNLLGSVTWERLHPTSRAFVATAEAEWRDRAGDPAHDPSAVLVGFAKVVELEANRALQRVLAKVPQELGRANIDGATVELAGGRALTLGQLAHVLEHEPALGEAIYRLGGDADWFATEWPPQLAEWARVRNAASHTGTVKKARARQLRDRLLGVGCAAVLGMLVGVGR